MATNNDYNNGCEDINFIELEMQHRAFVMELNMKRDQVMQLRKDLDNANFKIHELDQSLESMRKVKEEVEFHFNISIKNTRELEDKQNHSKDYIMRTRIKIDNLTHENRTLKELLIKAEYNNNEKRKQIEDMETEHNCHVIYQKDIIREHGKLTAFVDKCKETLEKLKINQTMVNEQANINDSNKILQQTVDHYKCLYDRLKEDNTHLENQLIRAETMSSIYKTYIDDINLIKIKTETDIFLDELIKVKENFKEERKLNEETISVLTETLAKENQTNAELWHRIVALEKQIDDHKKDDETMKDDETKKEDERKEDRRRNNELS